MLRIDKLNLSWWLYALPHCVEQLKHIIQLSESALCGDRKKRGQNHIPVGFYIYKSIGLWGRISLEAGAWKPISD